MEKLVGIATAVKHSTLISGEYGESQVHVATFLVNATQQVRLEAAHRPMIDDGDIVEVAGTPRSDLLKALAYKNLSTRARGNVGKMSNFSAGLAALAISYWGPGGLLTVPAAIAGVWCLINVTRIAAAERELEHA